MKLKTFFTTLSLAAAIGTGASAQIVNVQFDATSSVYTGPGALDQTSTSDTWNDVGVPSLTSPATGLLTTTGASTADSIGVAGFGSFAGGYNEGPAANLYNSFLTGGSPTAPQTITFGGLTANTVYNIAFYGDNRSSGSFVFDVDANGVTAGVEQLDSVGSTTGFISTLSPTLTAANGLPTYQGNYIELTDTSTATGQLTFSFVGDGSEFDLGGVSLQAVDLVTPEPSSVALMLAGLVAVGFFAFRRSKIQA